MEANRRTRGRRAESGAPALDLDRVEQEVTRKEEEAERRRKKERRSAMLIKQEELEEKNLPRNRAASLGSKMAESSGGGASKRRSKARSRRSGEEDENATVSHHSSSRHAKHSGSLGGAQHSVFSFLMPMTDRSDSESACSFSEVSLSTASVSTWRREESPGRPESVPGPWLKPNGQKLTRVLSGGRPAPRGLAAF